MPHIHIEYSANVGDVVNMGELCEAVRKCAVGIEALPMAGVRVRATCVDHYAIADGNPTHGFVDISLRMREGRPDVVKADAIQRIFDAAKLNLAPAMETHSIALSAEQRDIDKDLSPKFGTIRDHL